MSSQRFVLTLFCVVTGLSLATRGFAADFELQGGFSTDVGTSTYSFLQLGVETSLTEKVGFLAQATTSFLTFKSREEDKTIRAQAPSAVELIGLRYHLTDTTTISLLAGGQEKETRFFGAHLRFRNDDGFVTKAEFYSQLNPTTELVVLYRYSVPEASHYALVAPKHALFRFGSRDQFSFDLGVEALGGPEHRLRPGASGARSGSDPPSHQHVTSARRGSRAVHVWDRTGTPSARRGGVLCELLKLA